MTTPAEIHDAAIGDPEVVRLDTIHRLTEARAKLAMTIESLAWVRDANRAANPEVGRLAAIAVTGLEEANYRVRDAIDRMG